MELKFPDGQTSYGVIGQVVQQGEQGSPLALSNWRAEIYSQDFARTLPVRMSSFNFPQIAYTAKLLNYNHSNVFEELRLVS